MTTIEGVVEDAQPRQIGPGNVPGPLEPTVISLVEAARQMRKELKERYPGVRFSVRSSLHWYCNEIRVEYTDGPPQEEVEVLAEAYVGSWYESYAPGDGGCYHNLPGRWVGAEFVRYDVDQVRVYRETTAVRQQSRQWIDEYMCDREREGRNTMTLRFAASWLGLSERAVVKLINAGEIAATRGYGNAWDISIASLRAYAADRGKGEP
jgi:Large polyvalent protein associated domain 29